MEWSASRIRLWVNNRQCLTNTSGSPAFRQRHFMIFSQAIGAGTNGYTLQTPIPATMKVDYARFWR